MSVPKSRISTAPRRPATLLPRRNRRHGRSLEAAPAGFHPEGQRAVLFTTPGADSGAGTHAVELAGLLHELSVRLLAADDFAEALERLVALAAGALPGAVRCSVALIGDGEPLTRAAHGDAGSAYDEAQYEAGTGPALEAARTRTVVTVPDLLTDSRWPQLMQAARAEGVRASVAIPLDVPRAEVGALTLYLDRPGEPAPELLLAVMALVNQAAVLLGELRRREIHNVDATVDQAVGVIIAQRGCSVREAYDVLGETAQRLGLDRRQVADRLIAVAARRA